MWDQDVVSTYATLMDFSQLSEYFVLTVTNFFILGWKIQTLSPADRDLVRRPPVDVLLDPPLELRWNERLVEGSPQCSHFLLGCQFPNENGSHHYAWIHTERSPQKIDVTTTRTKEGSTCWYIVMEDRDFSAKDFWLHKYIFIKRYTLLFSTTLII